jgi:tetratricopeptide (TPR) repeat protein
VVLGFIYTGPHIISWFAERYAERPFTLTERILTQQRVILHYLTLIFFPHPSRLNLDYHFPLSKGLTFATVIAIAFIVMALFLTVRLARPRPVLSFCVFWFYTNLVIESSVLALEMVYEHRLYLPAIGIFLLFTIPFYDHILRFPRRRSWGLAGLTAVAAILCIFSFQRNTVWKDDMTLWSDVIKKSPDKSRPHNNLGNAYLSRGDPQRAIALHRRAIELDSKNHDAYYNLANDYLRIKRLEDTIGYYKKAVELKPDYAKAYANLGTVYNMMGRYDEAIVQARLALKHRPHYVDVYYNLGNAFFYKKDYQTALKHYHHVIKVKPDHDRAYNNLGGVYMLLNQPQKAIGYFQSAVRYSPLAPDYVNNLGMAYKKSGDLEEAINIFAKAIQIKPDYFEPYLNLARVMVGQEKIQEATQVLFSYLRINPDHAHTYMMLGLIFADYTAEKTRAIEFLQKSLQLDPNSGSAPGIREKIELIKKHRAGPGAM